MAARPVLENESVTQSQPLDSTFREDDNVWSSSRRQLSDSESNQQLAGAADSESCNILSRNLIKAESNIINVKRENNSVRLPLTPKLEDWSLNGTAESHIPGSITVKQEITDEYHQWHLHGTRSYHNYGKTKRTRVKQRKHKQPQRTLQVAWWNSRTLRPKGLDLELLELAEANNIDLIGVSETKIPDDDTRKISELATTSQSGSKWTWILAPGGTKQSGGIAVAVSDKLYDRYQCVAKRRNCIWVSVKGIKSTRDLYIAFVYIPIGPSGKPDLIAARQAEWNMLAAEIAQYEKLGIVMLGGDMNSRMNATEAYRGTKTAKDKDYVRMHSEMDAFAQHCNLHIVNSDLSKTHGTYTWTREDGKKRNILDYVLVNNLYAGMVQQLHIMEDHDMGSDHVPIMATIEYTWTISANNSMTAHEQANKRLRQKWRVNVGREVHELYEQRCGEYMQQWIHDAKAIMSLNQGRSGPLEQIVKKWEDYTKAAAIETYGTKRVNKNSVGFITKEVKALIQLRNNAARACNKAELQALGSGISLEDRDALRQTYNKARRAVRAARREIMQKEREELWRNIETTRDMKLYWKYISRLRGNRKRQPLNIVRDPSSGTLVTDPLKIVSVVKEYHERIGNGLLADKRKEVAKKADRFDEAFREEIEQELEKYRKEDRNINAFTDRLISNIESQLNSYKLNLSQINSQTESESDREQTLDCELTQLDGEITIEEVNISLKKLEQGKANGVDDIPTQLLKYGGDGMSHALCALFNYVLQTEQWPEQWSMGMIYPIYKDGDRDDLDQYRPITLLCLVSKLFESILNRRIYNYAERHGLLSETQGGFRSEYSSIDQAWILHEILTSRLEAPIKKTTCMAFLDVRKAYDTVWKDGLFVQMHRSGIRGKIWRMIQAMLANVKRKVIVGDDISEEFDIQLGLPQGSVLSPLLYDIFIDGLLKAIRNSGLGVVVSGVYGRVGALAYADDIVLLAENESDMQKLLDIVTEFARKWRFEFKHSKCGAVVYGAAINADEEPTWTNWMLAGQPIPARREYKYLGVEMGLSDSRRWKSVVDRYTGEAISKVGMLRSTGCYWGGLRPKECRKLYLAQVRPVIEYGMQLYRANKREIDKLDRMQYKFARTILDQSHYTSNVFLLCELGLLSVTARRDELLLRWWYKLCKQSQSKSKSKSSLHNDTITESRRLLVQVFRSRWTKAKKRVSKPAAINCLKAVLSKYKFKKEWREGVDTTLVSEEKWNNLVRETVHQYEISIRRNEMDTKLPSLTFYKHLPEANNIQFADYLNDMYNREGTYCKLLLRAGSLPLRAVEGRHNKWPEEQHQCQMCEKAVKENEVHFLIECSLYEDLRTDWIQMLESFLTARDFHNSQLACDLGRRIWEEIEGIMYSGDNNGMVLFILGSPQVFDSAQRATLALNPNIRKIPKQITQDLQKRINKHINNLLMHCWRRRTDKVKEMQQQICENEKGEDNVDEAVGQGIEQKYNSYLFPDMKTKYKMNMAKQMKEKERGKRNANQQNTKRKRRKK